MKEIFGNLWDVAADLRAITTNPTINRHGAAVMGRGCALEAKSKVPGLEHHFARRLKEHGNRVMLLARLKDGSRLASFPVKRHWRQEADPALVARSAGQLVALADKFGFSTVALPRPGCGNGRLSWKDVRPVLEGILDDRFSVITFPPIGRSPGERTGERWRVVRENQRTFRTGDVARTVVASGLTEEAEARAQQANDHQPREWAGEGCPLAFHVAEPG